MGFTKLTGRITRGKIAHKNNQKRQTNWNFTSFGMILLFICFFGCFFIFCSGFGSLVCFFYVCSDFVSLFSFSPPARWGLLDFIRVVLLLLLLLLHHLCLHFHVQQLFAKLFANFHTQWALLDLNCKGLSEPLDLNLGPSELSEHRWTSTWDPLGPSELSGHRWPSTAR